MKKIIITIATILLLYGCATNQFKNQFEVIGDNANNIEIKNLRSSRYNDLLIAQGMLYNDSNNTINGYYRCKFFDKDNFPINDDAPWELITIYSNQNKNFKCQATDINAVNFKVEFSDRVNNVKPVE